MIGRILAGAGALLGVSFGIAAIQGLFAGIRHVLAKGVENSKYKNTGCLTVNVVISLLGIVVFFGGLSIIAATYAVPANGLDGFRASDNLG